MTESNTTKGEIRKGGSGQSRLHVASPHELNDIEAGEDKSGHLEVTPKRAMAKRVGKTVAIRGPINGM